MLIQIIIIFTVITTSIAIFSRHYQRQHEQLVAANSELEKLATVDSLSGLFNRRKFLETLEQSFQDQNFTSLYVIMMDIDRFKQINDTY